MSLARVALATAVLLLSGGALLADEPVEATLVVPDARILPGVPFDFWIEIHNRTEDVRRVSICDPFQVRLVAGEPISWTETPGQTEPRGPFYWSHGGEAVVGPGQTRFLAVPAFSGLMARDFFRERLFSAPGRRFAIALRLCEQISSSGAVISRLLTNEVEIEIVTPTGSDALAWNLIEEKSSRRWTPADMESPESRAIWESVLRDSPDSSYVPHAILMTERFHFDDLPGRLARQLHTIRRFPDSPVLEWLHVEAWQTARSLRLHGVMLAEGAILRRSTRPTTRLLAFGNERP